LKFLTVDDSSSSRKLISSILGQNGDRVDEAENGEMGYAKAMENDYDLIITDIDMPEMDGVELCKKLKSDPGVRNVPILIVSKFDSDKEINRGFEAGASDYLLKQEVKDNLYPTVHNLLTQADFHSDQTILLIDDSITTLKLLAGKLSSYGFRVASARSRDEAVGHLNKEKISVILFDVSMPDIDPVEFIQMVKDAYRDYHIPIIAMSTNRDRRSMMRLKRVGISAFLIKPFNIDSLVVLVEKLVSDQYLFLLKEKEQLENEQKNLVDNITSLITALEARDRYTKGHSDNVSRISAGMVELSGGDRETVETVRRAALLHDIGKIGIPDSILNKPGRLSDEEYAQIKEHPEIGYRILKPISRLGNIHSIVRYHHERFDGNGYPQGLGGTEIPEWARIVAVADTFDALSNERTYKKAFGREESMKIIDEVRGTQLCPQSVELFKSYMEGGFDEHSRRR
jgi:response regulator RpfG family c-di-GMP phosphodiesterase